MTDETSFDPVHLPAEIEDPVASRGGYELHNHLALLYETRDEQFATVVPFIREGLERGEQCLYITSENSRDEILTELRAGDVDVDAALESGALLIHTAQETYLRDGMDAAEAGLEFIEDIVEKNATEFEGFRVTAERNWLLEHDVDVEQFLALEAFANDQFSDDDCISLCQYNRNQFPPAALDDVIRTHPYLIHENTICPNFYYQPPEEYFSPEQPRREIDRKLQTLTDRTRARATLEETTRYLQSQREIVAEPDRPFEEKLQGLLELGCDRLGLDFGAIATVDADDDRFEIEHISGHHEHLEPGIELPLSETYCAATADIEAATSVNDPDDDGFDDIVLYQEYGIQTYLGTFIPVENAPDRTLFFASSAPRPEPFSEIDHSFQDLLGQWVQYELDRQQREPEPGYHSEYTDDVLDAIDDVFYVLDADGNLQQWNDRLREVTGHSESGLASMHALDFFDGADVDAIAGGIANVFETGDARVEGDLRTADGEAIPYEFVATKLTDPHGDPVLAGIGRDISDRVEQRHERELFQTLLDHASDSVFVIDPNTGRFLDANETACSRLGYSRDELLDLSVPDIQSEIADRTAWQSYVEELATEKEVTFEGYHERRDGSCFPVEITDAHVELDREYVLAVARDVTERREREQELEERELQLSTMMENVPGMVYRCRNERGWPMEFVSDACEELTGYEPEALERGDVRLGEDIIVEQEQDEVWEQLQANVTNHEPFTVTYRIETADGEQRWVRDHGRGIFENGELVEIEGIISDITEEKRLKSELDEILGRVTDAFYALDDQWQFTHVNERAEELLGYSEEELIGETFWEQVPETAEVERIRERFRRAMETQEPANLEFNSELFGVWLEVNIYPSETGVSVYFRDITERKEREQDLELFRNLIDRSNDAVFVIDPETGQFLDVNDTASQRLGYERDELLEMSVPDIGKWFSESTDWESHVEELKAAGESTFEGVHQRKDGTAFPVEVNTTFVAQDREYLLAVSRDISERKERERFLRELYETTASSDLTFEEKVEELLALGQEWFDFDIGYFATADVENDQFEVIQAVGNHDSIQPGVAGSLSGTYCEEVIDSDQPFSVANAVAEGWEDTPAYETYGLDTYLGTSLEVNGELYGTLSLGSETPREDAFTDADYTFLELMGKWVSYELEREERETELRQTKERFRKIFEHSNDAIFINDPYEDEIVDANPAGLEMLGYDREELRSLGPSDCHPDEIKQFQAFVDTVFEDGHGWSDELTCLPKEGGPIPAEISASAIELHDRDLMLAIVRDITDRKQHERYQRELYEITADSELSFEEKIDRLLELGRERFGLDQGYLASYHQEEDVFENEYAVGPGDRDLQEGIPAAQPENEQFCRQTIERDEPLGVTDIRDRGWDDDPLHEENEFTSYFGVKIADGSGLYGTLWFGDTSPRERPYTETEDTFLELMGQWVSHELEQRRRETQLAALNEMGRELMNAETISEIADVAVEHIDGPLQLPISAVVAYDTETGQLAPAAQTPRAEDELPTATLCDGTSGPVWNAFVENETKVVDLTSDDEQFPTSDLTQLIAIPLGQQGILVTATTAAGGLTSSELELIDTTAATIEAASARADREQLLHERETALEEQNETLERLNRINTIIREIDQVLVQASTRAEIEAVVCEKLANVGPYELAWVGTHDPVTGDITPSEWDGAEKGYLDAVQISAGDEPIGRGPAGRAINTRQPQVVNDVLNDTEFEPWRQPALNRGYHSVISLPLEYEDTLYGILVVYASQPNVFDELEQTVLEEMADTIAYAINATESKKALMSDELTELEFSLDTTGTGVLELVRATGCTFSLESLVPQSDGSLRGFFSARGVPAEEVLEYESTLPVADLTVVSERTDGDETVCLFNATLNSESMAETVLDHGGRLSQFNATDGGATATVYLAADAEVREFVEMFQTRFPDATLTAQRTHERDHRTVQEFQSRVLEELTDRQLEVLQTAYFNGYFEEPRNQTASEIADTLGIAQPTFTSHTRVAQRKIFRHLFDEDPLQT